MSTKKALPYKSARMEIRKWVRQSNGQLPSVRQLKTVCGDDGSLATYSDYLKQWEREQANQKGLVGQVAALKTQVSASYDINIAMISQIEQQLRRLDEEDEIADAELAEVSPNLQQSEILQGSEPLAESLNRLHSTWDNDATGKWDIVDYDFQGAVEYDAQTVGIVSECEVRFQDDDQDAESMTAVLAVECPPENETEQAQPASLILEDTLLEAYDPTLPRSPSAAPVAGGITQGPNADDPHGSYPSGNNNGVDD